MEEALRIAQAVRDACLKSMLQAYEDAGLSGLCHEGIGNALSMPYVRWIFRRWCRPSHRRPHVFLRRVA
jgi:hypothetical protein